MRRSIYVSFYLPNDDSSEYKRRNENVVQVFASSNTLGILEYWSLTPRRGACTLLEALLSRTNPLRDSLGIAATPLSSGHGGSQAYRQERDTMMRQSVRTEVLIVLGWKSGCCYVNSATSLPTVTLDCTRGWPVSPRTTTPWFH